MTWPICSRGSATYGGNRHRPMSNSQLSTGYSLARTDDLLIRGCRRTVGAHCPRATAPTPAQMLPEKRKLKKRATALLAPVEGLAARLMSQLGKTEKSSV